MHVAMMMTLADQQVVVVCMGADRMGLRRAASGGVIMALEMMLSMNFRTVDGTATSDADDLGESRLTTAVDGTGHWQRGGGEREGLTVNIYRCPSEAMKRIAKGTTIVPPPL